MLIDRNIDIDHPARQAYDLRDAIFAAYDKIIASRGIT